MATVLIVSRTQMANGICVGGINEDTGELIRLHNEKVEILNLMHLIWLVNDGI